MLHYVCLPSTTLCTTSHAINTRVQCMSSLLINDVCPSFPPPFFSSRPIIPPLLLPSLHHPSSPSPPPLPICITILPHPLILSPFHPSRRRHLRTPSTSSTPSSIDWKPTSCATWPSSLPTCCLRTPSAGECCRWEGRRRDASPCLPHKLLPLLLLLLLFVP